jgi:peptide/nickel transport system substrate-binding protein
MLGASRAGLEVLSVPGTMQAVFQFWGTYKPEVKDSPIAKARVRQALSLAIDRKQVIEHVMNGRARMPYPFATFGYTDYFSADRWEKWAAEAYRYDPVLAKKILAEEGYPNGFELEITTFTAESIKGMAQIVANQLNSIGVKASVQPTELGAYRKKQGDGQTQSWSVFYPLGGHPDASAALSVWFEGERASYFNNDPIVIDAMAEGLRETDAAKRDDIYKRAFDRINEMHYHMPITSIPTVFVHTKDIAVKPGGRFEIFGFYLNDLSWK